MVLVLRIVESAAVAGGMFILRAFWRGFSAPHTRRQECIRKDKAMRDHLTEKQIDRMIQDTFPASDPVTMY